MKPRLEFLAQGEWWALVLLIYAIPLDEALKNVLWGVVVALRLVRTAGLWSWGNCGMPCRAMMPWLACGLFASMFAIEPSVSWKGMWDMMRGAAMLWVAGGWVADEERRVALVRHLVLASALASLWGLLQYGFTHLSAQIRHVELPYYVFVQLRSVGHFNQSGIYLAMAWLVALAAVLDGRVFSRAIVGHVCLGITGFALLGTTARTAIAVSVLFSVWMLWRSRPSRWVTSIALAMVVMGLAVVILSPAIRSRMLYHGSFSARASIWEPACKVAILRPWTGVGLNNFKNIHLSSSSPILYSTVDHAHNLYINTLVQTGFPGLAALLLLLGMLMHGLWLRRPSAGGDVLLFQAGVGVLGVVLLVGTSNTSLHHELSMVFFLVMGLALGCNLRFQAGNTQPAAARV